jgi:hypothetical protein
MSKKEKLIKRLKSKPKDFTYNEADTLLLSLGMRRSNKGKTSGSRLSYSFGHIIYLMHKPHPRKELSAAQINELVDLLESEGLI